MNKIISLLAVIFLAIPTQSQELLTVEEAVKIALENNFEIRVAANELEIDRTGVSIGNAGMLPTVGVAATTNNSIMNSSQTRADGNLIELDDARNNSLNYGVVLDWTIFDGFRMFARYDQLKEFEKLGEARLQQTILSRVSDVMITYFEIVQQQQQLAALDSTMIISRQRVELANNRWTIGRSSKLEVLNAQVDLNTDRTMLLREQEEYENLKIRLNQIMARDTKIDFRVIDKIPVDEKLFLPELEALAARQNPLLQAQVINNNIARLQLKQVRAGRFPSLVASTGYQFNESESSLGFTTSASSRGWNYGLSARLNIFDGFNQNRNEKIARIQIENTELVVEQQTLELESQLGRAYQTYLTNINLVELESENEAIARENLEITVEKFRIGTIPTIEFRTAQLNYINSIVRHSNARFQAKLSEISLKEFAGILNL
ncbi:TolC family protein [soil metagenome]